jgi:hypothetical protein
MLSEFDLPGKVVLDPFCGYESWFKKYVSWQFKFYDVNMFYCPKYKGTLNHHHGVGPRREKGFRVYH